MWRHQKRQSHFDIIRRRQMRKILFTSLVLLALISASCSSKKTVDTEDEFAVQAAGETSGEASTGGDLLSEGDGELSLDEGDKTTQAKSSSDEVNLENELDSLSANEPAAEPAKAPELEQPQEQVAQAEPPQPEPAIEPPAIVDTTPQEQVPPTPEVAVQPEETTPPVPQVVEAEPLATIKNLTYQGNSNGGTVVVDSDQPLKFTTRMNSVTNQFVVEVGNSVIPDKFKRSLNTKDMSSPIGSVDIYQKAKSNIVRLVVQLRANAPEPIVQPEGNSLLIIGSGKAQIEAGAVAMGTAEAGIVSPDAGVTQAMGDGSVPTAMGAEPVSAVGGAARANGKATAYATQEVVDLGGAGVMDSDDLEKFLISNNKFYGKKISIETGGMDVKEFIAFIAEESGINIVIDEAVAGKVSLKLKNVPWDQALVLILKQKKLAYKRQGNVLRISTLESLLQEELVANQLKDLRKAKESMVVKRFFIGYADIEQLEGQIKEFLNIDLGNVNAAGMSSGAQAGTSPTAPPATGATASVAGAGGGASSSSPAGAAQSLGSVISDKRTNSIIVTTTEENMGRIVKIIEALDTQPQQVLIEAKVVEAQENFTQGLGVKWNSVPSTATTTNTARIGINPILDPGAVVFDSLLSWGQLDILGQLNAQLSLGEREDKVRVLSSPRVAVLSGEEAKIEQTASVLVPSATTTSSTGTTQSFTNVPFGVTLKVNPVASNEGTVSLKLNLERSFLARTDSQTPDVRKADTKIIVRSGQTAVIGGIFNSEARNSDSGVTGLKDIPILGTLFKSQAVGKNKNELVIFVTPTILKPVKGSNKIIE